MALNDLGAIKTGKTPSTKVQGHFGGNVPFVTPRDMDGKKKITETERCLTEKGVKAVKSALIPAGSIMVSCIGSDMGKVAIAGRECVTNQQINSIIVSENYASEYVYYDLSQRKSELRSMASGSAQPILNKGHFAEVEIEIPDIEDQRAIAHILGSLDDKIELNRRMNETLEAMASAIFKSWFVDFDPVRAKAKGRDAGLPGEIAELFSDSFEDSELGKIPKGWGCGSIYEICEIIYGAPFKSKLFTDGPDGLPVIRIRDLKTMNPAKYTSEQHPKSTLIQSGDLLVGMDAEFRATIWLGQPGLLNQRVLLSKPNNGINTWFLKEIFEPLLEDEERAQVGTTVAHLGKKDIDQFRCLVSRPVNSML